VQHETDHLLGEPYIDALAVDRRRHTMRLLRNRPV
jgi:peptide deformylase